MKAAGKPLYRSLYFQVITAIVIGIALGHFYPETGAAMKPLGDGFIKLIKMIIAPIIFCTVVVGIAGMEDMKKVGKTGGYALLYFEIVSSIALVVGLTIVPGIVWFLLKVAFFMFAYIWLRSSFPRIRYDRLMAFGWKVLLPVATLNLIITAAYVAVRG